MDTLTYTAFSGDRIVASGTLEELLAGTKAFLDRGGDPGVLAFEDQTGRQVDFDFRGTAAEVIARAVASPARPGPGRPRLGVVSREVTLLPQHWEWLEAQPSGISAALRRLVDAARRHPAREERARRAREAASRFMTAMAGNRPGYEEATRALFAGDRARFDALVRAWPKDVRDHLRRIAADGLSGRAAPRARRPRRT
jgi:hypothetical protein